MMMMGIKKSRRVYTPRITDSLMDIDVDVTYSLYTVITYT